MRDANTRTVDGVMIAGCILYAAAFCGLLLLIRFRSSDPIPVLGWMMRFHLIAVFVSTLLLSVTWRFAPPREKVVVVVYAMFLGEFAAAYWLWSAAVTAV